MKKETSFVDKAHQKRGELLTDARAKHGYQVSKLEASKVDARKLSPETIEKIHEAAKITNERYGPALEMLKEIKEKGLQPSIDGGLRTDRDNMEVREYVVYLWDGDPNADGIIKGEVTVKSSREWKGGDGFFVPRDYEGKRTLYNDAGAVEKSSVMSVDDAQNVFLQVSAAKEILEDNELAEKIKQQLELSKEIKEQLGI